ncbi:MAG: hypothetical protein EOP04_09780 [Proteobacteria bacterium]|nr:MAG: hypothetical protein EOP04_09780 [Pseudomonadota bacterium]
MIPVRASKAFETSLEGFFEECFGAPVVADSVTTHLPIPTQDVCASIAFNSEKLNGNLFLSTTLATLKASNPLVAMGEEVNEEELQEWAGEMANQTLGRFRHLMLTYDVSIEFSIPTVIQGPGSIANTSGEALIRQISLPDNNSIDCVITFDFSSSFDAASMDTSDAQDDLYSEEGACTLL